MRKLIGILLLCVISITSQAYCYWVYIGEGMYIYRQQCQDGGGEPYWSGACAWTSEGGMEYPCFAGVIEADPSLVQNESIVLALMEPKEVVAWYAPTPNSEEVFLSSCYYTQQWTGNGYRRDYYLDNNGELAYLQSQEWCATCDTPPSLEGCESI